MRTIPFRRALTAFAAALYLVAPPAGAFAGGVALSGDRLEVNGSKAANKLVIGLVGNQIRVEEHSEDERLATSSPRCEREAVEADFTRIVCSASGIREAVVKARGGNDWVVVGRSLPESRSDRSSCSGSKIGAELIVGLGEGNDVAELSAGTDEVRGEGGRDLLMGCGGDDLIAGGPDADHVSGDRGNDRLRAQGGNDSVYGCSYDPDDVNYPREESGDDDLDGGEGDDFLYGCNGLDTFAAGTGDDDLNTRDELDEVADCGEGIDLIYLDPNDSRPGCETVTNCVTDNYPIGPETGDPECFPSGSRRSPGPSAGE